MESPEELRRDLGDPESSMKLEDLDLQLDTSWYKDVYWTIWVILEDLYYGITRFFRNIWLFRAELWRWRSFDHGFQYMLLVRGLELLRDHIREHKHHVRWAEDAEEIDLALKYYRKYRDPVDDWANLTPYEQEHWPDIEERNFELFCEMLKRHSRKWWC